MKSFLKHTTAILMTPLLFSCAVEQVSSSKEYDNLYFTSADRNPVKYTNLNKPQQAEYKSGEYVYNQEVQSDKFVNPEYLAKYANENNTSASSEEETYYIAEEDRIQDVKTRNNSTNRRDYFSPFGSGFAGYTAFGNPVVYDPFFDPWFSAPFGSVTRLGFNSGFGMGMGLGMGGYNMFGFNSFNNPMNTLVVDRFGRTYAVNPFGRPGFTSFNRFGYGSFGGYGGYGGYGGLYYPPVNGTFIANGNESNATRMRASSQSRNYRSSRSVSNDMSNRSRRSNSSTTRVSTPENGRVNTSDFQFQSSQNEYYRSASERAAANSVRNASLRSRGSTSSYSPRSSSVPSRPASNSRVAPSNNGFGSTPSYDRGRSYNNRSRYSTGGSRGGTRSISPSRSRGSRSSGTRSSGSSGSRRRR
jgi:hypothetical protein